MEARSDLSSGGHLQSSTASPGVVGPHAFAFVIRTRLTVRPARHEPCWRGPPWQLEFGFSLSLAPDRAATAHWAPARKAKRGELVQTPVPAPLGHVVSATLGDGLSDLIQPLSPPFTTASMAGRVEHLVVGEEVVVEEVLLEICRFRASVRTFSAVAWRLLLPGLPTNAARGRGALRRSRAPGQFQTWRLLIRSFSRRLCASVLLLSATTRRRGAMVAGGGAHWCGAHVGRCQAGMVLVFV